ncbi:hypothetical protein SPHINGO361_100422 [Sphingomonas sp. EC-HK361]|nr:hypothetical protein SPHINGO361_100422 [Sphingomonas sp. EC-HK361]
MRRGERADGTGYRQKKGPAPKSQPMKVFRRGCLKGPPYVRRGSILCKCEKIDVNCRKCTRGLANAWVACLFCNHIL